MTAAVEAPDRDVRRRIVETRGVSLAVEAGAGTGKTTLLVDRVVSRLQGGAPLSRLAVITFTRKAAAELVARVRKKLVEHRERGAAWAAAALDDFDGASIGTTDSFCRSILSDFPVEAGTTPGFGLVDEVAQTALQDLAWTRFLEGGEERAARILTRLRDAGVKPGPLREVADGILSSRDLGIPEAAGGGEGGVLDAFEEHFGEAWALRSRCRDDSDALFARLHELDELRRAARAVGGTAGDRLLLSRGRDGRRRRWANHRLGRAPAWGGAGNKGTVIDALQRLDDAVDEALSRVGAALAAETAHWLGGYLDEYAAVKRERNLLDFRDLALLTRDLLRDHASIRRRVAARFEEILIDEMQDTDPLQMEIALLLAADGGVPADVFDADLVPGKLFLVGDPKQSIYRFRRADIELYDAVRRRVGGDAPAAVHANFRSHPAILHFVNRVFAGWMEPPDGAPYQARYSELWPSRDADDDGDGARVSLILPDPAIATRLAEARGLRATERGELEIDAVARALRRGLGFDGEPAMTVVDPLTGETRPALPRDVAVIVRKIDWGDRLLDRLRRIGIPATVAGGRRFWMREEIQTLAALLDAVVDPDDRLARFAALRSPALGFRDDALALTFLREDGHVEDEPPAEVADAIERLHRLSAAARRLPVPDFLESLAEELCLLSVFGLRPDGTGRMESLRILLEAADALVEAGLDSLPALARWLKQQTGEASVEGPGEPDPGDRGGVQILTIHKAKGLEFPIVVLADLAGRARTRETIVADRAAGRIEFRLGQAAAVETPGFAAAWEEERLRQKAEEVRLLYVAMTRARDHLFLSWPEGSGGFLEHGAEGELARRIGCAPGQAAPPGSGVATVRADDLPPLEDADSSAIVEPAGIVTAPRPCGAGPEARRQARRGVRVLAATAVGRSAAAEDRAWTDLPLFAPGPGGREFGTLIHRALEIWEPGTSEARRVVTDAARIVAPRLAREGRRAFRFRDEDLDEAVRYLERVTADPAVTAVWAASRVLREVPFVLPLGEDFVAGTIDVLVEGHDGTLSIVDWKTDRIGRQSGHAARERYRAQALTYAHAATRITGRRVRDVRFLFLSTQPVETGSFLVGPDLDQHARALLGAARMA